MKNLTNFIIEKFVINKNTIVDNVSYETFKSDIQELFDLNNEEYDHMIKCFSTDLNIDKLKKSDLKLIGDEHKHWNHIANICAELINHPDKYKKIFSIDILYSSVTRNIDIDLRVFLYTMDDDSKFLCFLNYDDNKFYIYSYEEHK